MWESIGAAAPWVSVAAVVIVAIYFGHREKLRKMEIIERERRLAIEKGIPLPELPVFEAPPQISRMPPNPHALPLTGIILLALSAGAMLILYLNLPAPAHGFWVLPLPMAFVGIGLLIYHWLPKKLD